MDRNAAREPVSVFYNSHADERLYAIIRERMRPGMRLLALAADDEAERLAKLGEADAAIVAATPLTARQLEAASRLRLVHHQGVGYQDTVPVDALRTRGIPLALTPQGTTQSVAETAIMLMLAALRRLPFADSELRLGRWHINSLRPVSRNLNNRVVGYVGMGRIGRATAALARAFGATGLYSDPFVTLDPAEEERLGVAKAELGELLARADIVTLHAPPGGGRQRLIDREAIARMKAGAIIVNTARGSLIDEAALVEGLASGKLGGAALDVFAQEPPPASSPLLSMPNVVLTPHIAGGTRDAFEQKMDFIFANIERFFSGQALEQQVDMPAGGAG